MHSLLLSFIKIHLNNNLINLVINLHVAVIALAGEHSLITEQQI